MYTHSQTRVVSRHLRHNIAFRADAEDSTPCFLLPRWRRGSKGALGYIGGNVLNKLVKIRGLLTLTLTIAIIVCAGSLRAEMQDLVIGKYSSSVAFPCKPERQKQLIAKTETGDIFLTSLKCSQGDNAYVLGVTEYPAQIVSALSVEEMLDSTLDDARSKNFIKIKSSKRTAHQNLSAIRSHLLDSRKPETETIGMAVLAGRNIIVVQVTAPPSSAQSKASTDFVSSLKITAVKK